MGRDALIRQLITNVIDAYHTTRMANISAVDHILSKKYVQDTLKELDKTV